MAAAPAQYEIMGAVGSRYEPLREIELRARNPDADVLLQFRGNRNDYKTVVVCTGASVDLGADLVTLRFPEGSDLSLIKGVLSNKSGMGGLWQTDLTVIRGYDGAPVFATDGRVVGSVSGGTAGVAGRNFFTPIDAAAICSRSCPSLPLLAQGFGDLGVVEGGSPCAGYRGRRTSGDRA